MEVSMASIFGILAIVSPIFIWTAFHNAFSNMAFADLDSFGGPLGLPDCPLLNWVCFGGFLKPTSYSALIACLLRAPEVGLSRNSRGPHLRCFRKAPSRHRMLGPATTEGFPSADDHIHVAGVQ